MTLAPLTEGGPFTGTVAFLRPSTRTPWPASSSPRSTRATARSPQGDRSRSRRQRRLFTISAPTGHVYAEEGNYTVNVSVLSISAGVRPSRRSSAVTVTDAPIAQAPAPIPLTGVGRDAGLRRRRLVHRVRQRPALRLHRDDRLGRRHDAAGASSPPARAGRSTSPARTSTSPRRSPSRRSSTSATSAAARRTLTGSVVADRPADHRHVERRSRRSRVGRSAAPWRRSPSRTRSPPPASSGDDQLGRRHAAPPRGRSPARTGRSRSPARTRSTSVAAASPVTVTITHNIDRRQHGDHARASPTSWPCSRAP